MDEYIKRDLAIEFLPVAYDSAINAIRNVPAADVVQVVRCKDCKHRYHDSWCEYVDDDDNFYCARGERKEGQE